MHWYSAAVASRAPILRMSHLAIEWAAPSPFLALNADDDDVDGKQQQCQLCKISQPEPVRCNENLRADSVASPAFVLDHDEYCSPALSFAPQTWCVAWINSRSGRDRARNGIIWRGK